MQKKLHVAISACVEYSIVGINIRPCHIPQLYQKPRCLPPYQGPGDRKLCRTTWLYMLASSPIFPGVWGEEVHLSSSNLPPLNIWKLASASITSPLRLPFLLWLTGFLRKVASPSSTNSSLFCHWLGGSPFSFSRVAWKLRRRWSLLPAGTQVVH